jgi:starch synthase
VVGFAKTGGLADVVGTLPVALARHGHTCSVVMPLYHSVRTSGRPLAATGHIIHVPVGNRTVEGRLWQSTLPSSDVPVILIEQREYFERDDPSHGRSLYQYTEWGGTRRDYPDNFERFAFFCRAVLDAVRILELWPDVLHANDWQTGLVPVYLREIHSHYRDPALSDRYGRIKTLFTVHNIAYQGNYPPHNMNVAGLDWRLFNHDQLEFYGQLSLMKGGIVFSDFVNTVSPMYAREIQTPYYGCGLQGTLYHHRHRLSGIVNGADYSVWDPATDRFLPANYSPESIDPGKARCKEALQRRYGLPEQPETPLLGVVARLADQKGIDLILPVARAFLQHDTQLVLLGDGEMRYQQALHELKGRFPTQVGLTIGFDEGLAHQIEAGADAFLMPSKYEPSGLNQLYSMKYGTPPIVRATGGLADTVVDTTPSTLDSGTATGFSFGAYAPEAFQDAVWRALTVYRTRPDQWRQVMVNGMKQDWSWDRSAGEYARLYERIVTGK